MSKFEDAVVTVLAVMGIIAAAGSMLIGMGFLFHLGWKIIQ